MGTEEVSIEVTNIESIQYTEAKIVNKILRITFFILAICTSLIITPVAIVIATLLSSVALGFAVIIVVGYYLMYFLNRLF